MCVRASVNVRKGFGLYLNRALVCADLRGASVALGSAHVNKSFEWSNKWGIVNCRFL